MSAATGKGRGAMTAKLTSQHRRILSAADVIAGEAPSDQDKAFMSRQLVQTTLPHADPGNVPVWSRTNGNVTLTIQPGVYKGQMLGYPYGTIPRLLLYWITTEAIRTREPKLILGDSLAAFMDELGLDSRRKGPRSDRVRLQEQMRRLFAARITFEGEVEQEDLTGEVTDYPRIARRTMFWWNRKDDPGQRTLWESWVELDDDFYKSITANPVPVDLRALRAIKRSPLALDLYSLMTYQAFRASRSGRPLFMSWKQLQTALGTSYADHADLRKAIKESLRKIQVVYPGLVLSSREGGLEVLPRSLPSVAAR